MYSSPSSRFVPEVERELRKAGWYPGRALSDEQMKPWLAIHTIPEVAYCRIFPAAWAILREFGGLTLELSGPGISCGRSALCIDPLNALEEGEIYTHDYLYLKETLYPLGKMGTDNVLAVSIASKVYSVIPSHRCWGLSFAEALHNLVLGIMPKHIKIANTEIYDKMDEQIQASMRHVTQPIIRKT